MMPPVAGNTALFLDIDGTLLDVARAPDLVVVPDALRGALQHLCTQLRGALAFVSGRSLDDIDSLFAPFRPAAIGAHGAEVRRADGAIWRAGPLPQSARDIFAGLERENPGLLLEDKSCALALHYRLAPEARPALEAAMQKHRALFESEKIDILHGKAVIEARHRGMDKGSAVARLAKEKPFVGRSVIFGGDDTTDMDVFHILPELGGQGFSVGRAITGAAYEFPSPEAVRQWLGDLAERGIAA